MSEARVWAQAKINLLLRVLAREASGYHSIETLMLRLDLGDDVVVRVGGTGRSIDTVGHDIPPETNLAWRAAVAYADATGWPDSFAIEVRKHIPVGGGLGGGSADAGAVLRALDALAPHPLRQRLPEVGASLGADVPFLTVEQPMALAWGRGERLLGLPPLPARPVALVLPGFGVSTKAAYGWLADARAAHAPLPAVRSVEHFASWQSVAALAANDFEPVVFAHHPELGAHVEALRAAGARIALMSGSGSSLFGIFDEKPGSAALTAATGARVVVTRTTERVVGVERSG